MLRRRLRPCRLASPSGPSAAHRSLRWLAALAAAVGALGLSSSASASPETLRRAVSNVAMCGLDIALSPMTAGYSLATGLRDVDDTALVRVVYTVPGYLWNTGTHIGAGGMRGLAGLIELIPGIGLFFFETDLDPIFTPVDRAEALVNYDTDVLQFKFGIIWTAPAGF